MALPVSPVNTHWNYFLALEEDLIRLSRFVEFNEDNHKCYSLEILRILLAAGAETDVVCKVVCKKIEPSASPDTINAYRDILRKYFKIADYTVLMPRYGHNLIIPWDEWKKPDGVPIWWKAYNKAKHRRDTHYKDANLYNAINAVAGLFVICLYFYQLDNEPHTKSLNPTPTVFTIPDISSQSEFFWTQYKLLLA